MATIKKKPTEEKQPTKKAPVFDKETLIKGAKEFGTTPELMAGALYDVKEPLTKDQAKEKLETFLARPINNKGGK